MEIAEGRVFIDTPAAGTTALVTPGGPLQLAQVRASIDATSDGTTEAYVLSGEVRGSASVRATNSSRPSVSPRRNKHVRNRSFPRRPPPWHLRQRTFSPGKSPTPWQGTQGVCLV